MPFRYSEQTLLIGYETWSATFNANKMQIANIKKLFVVQIVPGWGDIGEDFSKFDNDNCAKIEIFDKIITPTQENGIEEYDIMNDLNHIKNTKLKDSIYKKTFSEIANPFLLSNEEY